MKIVAMDIPDWIQESRQIKNGDELEVVNSKPAGLDGVSYLVYGPNGVPITLITKEIAIIGELVGQ